MRAAAKPFACARGSKRQLQEQLLSDTPLYEERSSVYKNGEIWLSYGDGMQEAALLEGKPAP
jgi:hypothetical protein